MSKERLQQPLLCHKRGFKASPHMLTTWPYHVRIRARARAYTRIHGQIETDRSQHAFLSLRWGQLLTSGQRTNLTPPRRLVAVYDMYVSGQVKAPPKVIWRACRASTNETSCPISGSEGEELACMCFDTRKQQCPWWNQCRMLHLCDSLQRQCSCGPCFIQYSSTVFMQFLRRNTIKAFAKWMVQIVGREAGYRAMRGPSPLNMYFWNLHFSHSPWK